VKNVLESIIEVFDDEFCCIGSEPYTARQRDDSAQLRVDKLSCIFMNAVFNIAYPDEKKTKLNLLYLTACMSHIFVALISRQMKVIK